LGLVVVDVVLVKDEPAPPPVLLESLATDLGQPALLGCRIERRRRRTLSKMKKWGKKRKEKGKDWIFQVKPFEKKKKKIFLDWIEQKGNLQLVPPLFLFFFWRQGDRETGRQGDRRGEEECRRRRMECQSRSSQPSASMAVLVPTGPALVRTTEGGAASDTCAEYYSRQSRVDVHGSVVSPSLHWIPPL